MDKSWRQLADRCQLFYEANDGLYISLLKEAELVMANKCSLYKEHFTYKFNANTDSNSQVLPSNYKSMINVWVDGNLIPYRDKSNWSFTKGDDALYPVMKVSEGTPSFYDLANGHIVFDKVPSSSTTIDIYYRANVDKTLTKPLLMLPVAGGKVKINTNLGAEILGATVVCEDNGSANTIILDGQVSTTSQQYVTPSQIQDYNNTVVGEQHQILLTEYVSGSDWDVNEPPTQLYLQQGWIENYRNYAPLIDGDYHLDLCEYAIYIASAKVNPDLSMKHLQIWESRIQEILNDNIDKELPTGIREEI